jgi:hypothetical protein
MRGRARDEHGGRVVTQVTMLTMKITTTTRPTR